MGVTGVIIGTTTAAATTADDQVDAKNGRATATAGAAGIHFSAAAAATAPFAAAAVAGIAVAAAAGTVFFGMLAPIDDKRLALFYSGMLFLPAALVALAMPEERKNQEWITAP